jgi:phosphatidate cytidylyltransferase
LRFEREISGAIAIPVVLAILWFAPPWAFGLLAAAVGVATLHEFFRLAEASGIPVPKRLGLSLGAAALVFAVFPPVRVTPVAAAVAAFAVAALFATAALAAAVPLERALAACAAPLFGFATIVLPVSAMVWLDRVTVPGAGSRFGPRAILFLFVTIWGCDSFAYYSGRKFGRHKLAPRVSPKKTIEGSVGGLVGSILVAAVAAAIFLREFSPLEAALWGGAASTAGQIGDLVESLVKRGAGVKDSGRFLPGHGGFYDRVDSLLFALPVLCAAVLIRMGR